MITDWEKDIYKREMENWIFYYPFTGRIMLTEDRPISDKEVLELIRIGEKRRNEI